MLAPAERFCRSDKLSLVIEIHVGVEELVARSCEDLRGKSYSTVDG